MKYLSPPLWHIQIDIHCPIVTLVLSYFDIIYSNLCENVPKSYRNYVHLKKVQTLFKITSFVSSKSSIVNISVNLCGYVCSGFKKGGQQQKQLLLTVKSFIQ